MRKIIDHKVYDTKTSRVLADTWYGNSYEDFNFLEEILYQTPNGRFFLYESGGAFSKMGRGVGTNSTGGSSDITPLDKDAAAALIKKWHDAGDISAAEYSIAAQRLGMAAPIEA